MITYKYRRKVVLLALCIFAIVTIHNMQGNNLNNWARNQQTLIKTLDKNLTKNTYRSASLTRLIVDKLDNKSRHHSISDDLDTYVVNILSNGHSEETEFVQNKTHMVFLPADKFKQIKKILDEVTVVDDKTYNNSVNKENLFSQHVSHNSSRAIKSIDNVEKESIIGQERSNEYVDENVADDEYNEFDITDLDEHITFLQQPLLQKQLQQLKAKQNAQNTQLSERKRFRWNGQYDIQLNNSLEYRKLVYRAHARPIQNRADINCKDLVEKNIFSEIVKAKQVMKHLPRKGISTEKYVRTIDCENYRGGRGYIEHPLSQMELDFPLAFSILAYKDVEQAERLLRAIYRPHNFYCFHLDLKMAQFERTAFEKIVRCLKNVFITERSVNVTWGGFSVLEAELLCMEQLWQYKKWKYYINLTGQEFPLKTNREIVAILNSLEGANIVDGTWIRAKQKYFYRWTIAGNPPPHNIRPIKGSVHVALNRQFVDFALHDNRSRDFLEWLKKTQIPDETFFASLNHNPHLGINGSFLGEAEEYPLKPSLMRYKNWEIGHSVFVRGCAGKYVRNICVLGVGDLHKAYSDIGLFVNKLNIDFEYLALDCLEEVLYQKTWDQYINDVTIDTTYFKHLDYVKRKLFVAPNK